MITVSVAPEHPYLVRLRAYLGARYSPDTVYNTIGQARRFLAVAGTKQAYSRDDVLRYVDHLIAQGYKAQSITVILNSVKPLFRAMVWPWPVERGDLHFRMPQEESGGVVTPGADVMLLIGASRRLGIPEKPVVALASTYGLRPSEIAQVISAGLGGLVLEVQTSKGGRKRLHGIPPALKDALTFRPYPISRGGLHAVFERLMKHYVREPVKGEGWHSVRRSLVTGLYQAGVADFHIQRWMGWRVNQNIVYSYTRPDPAWLDGEVYSHHPFLPAWS